MHDRKYISLDGTDQQVTVHLMTNHLYAILICLIFFEVRAAYTQPGPAPLRVDLTLEQDEENLNVLDQWIRWNSPGSLLIDHLVKQAFDYYEVRDLEISKLATRNDWIARQQLVRDKLLELVGPFPDKSPLNPRITGTVKKDGYRIEKIVYESMPEFYVTACLFIPDGIEGKAPAILNLIGHEQESFRAELDQVIILNLVKKGIIVLTIDPLGQGEHVQYFDPQVKFSSVGYSVIEHCYFGNQCFLSGACGARYFIWDGIRALDYLVSRQEVDPQRIGVTGFSGGGTVTSYLGALDDRVKVAVPSSWSTASRRQLETRGAQDAETGFPGGVANGITFEDLIEVRAPRPTLMTFVSRDQYLSLQGAREAYLEAAKAYQAFEKEENLVLVEDDSKHWLTPKIRLAIYSFFMKHFNISGDPSEQEIERLSPEELQVTSTGQISTSLGGKMVFDVNKIETEKLIENLDNSRKDLEKHLNIVLPKAREISGYTIPVPNQKDPFINGRYQREGYSVVKYALDGEGDYVIPILLFIPHDNAGKHPALVYIHPEGKIRGAGPGGEIEQFVKQGYLVAAIDVLGVGETRNTATRGLAAGYTGVLTGSSVVGIQAGDIVRVVNYLKNCEEVDSDKIGAVAFDGMCLPLIHAAAFDSSINSITLIRPLISYRSVAMNRYYRVGLSSREGGDTWHPYEVDFYWGIAGVLTTYDLPDLIGCIAPRKVMMVELKDQMLDTASKELIDEEMKFPISAYAFKNASDNLKVVPYSDNIPLLLDWCFR